MAEGNANNGDDRQIFLEDYREFSSEASERLRFQVELSQSMLKSLQFVNAGAIVALLTFLGNSEPAFDPRAIWWAFFWFCAGLALSLFAYVGAYLSQGHFMNVAVKQAWNAQQRARARDPEYDFKWEFLLGNIFLVCGFAAALSSVVAFISGAFVALEGLS